MIDVLIIGGGFAGLAAGVGLAEKGKRVLLLERRSFLGGRAYSFKDKTTGTVIDNGQHMMMGCYHHTLEFLSKLGTLDKLEIQRNPRVDFLYAGINGSVNSADFKCPSLPSPLHLLGGLARLKSISVVDRINALRVGLELKRLGGDYNSLESISVDDWLKSLGQSETIRHKFWNIMALATLNTPAEEASADMFAVVLELGFMKKAADSAMIIPKAGLSDIYVNPAIDYIRARGGEVRTNADVINIEFDGDRATSAILRNGERLSVKNVIVAAPHNALLRMLPNEIVQANNWLSDLSRYEFSPIVSVNLWYDRPVTDRKFVSLLNSDIEWVYNKSLINSDGDGAEAESGLHHMALVISGASHWARMTNAEVTEMAIREMKRFFPAVSQCDPVHRFILREHGATIYHSKGLSNIRPPQNIGLSNLFIIGDWTNTGLPATIESAVKSANDCISGCQLSVVSCQ